MTEKKVSHRYAKAVMETAIQEKCTDEVFKSFAYMDSVIGSSRELRAFLLNPIILPWKKKKILSEIFEGKVHALNYHFIMLLVDKGREVLIPSIIEQFNEQYNDLNNNISIEIYSANELAKESRKSIVDKLSAWTKKQVLPVYKIDKSLRGGVMIRIGDWVYDYTIKSQLDTLYRRLAEE